jgi:2-dehydro-3-deoxyglucarate aldolase/4-hydroxy-2-oxoheptanedioate aldolase
MFHRPLTDLLRPGRPIRLIWLALGSVPLAELAALAQPDAVLLDLQHGLWERSTMEAAIGIANARVPVLVRTADGSLPAIAQALDAGAAGVLVPMIDTAEDARRIVDAGRYPPLGHRSAGGVRPLMLGIPAMVEADKHLALGALIETVQGVANARDICAVDGLDFIFIGTGDLAISRGKADPAGLADCCAHVRTEAHARGLPCGLFTTSTEAARQALGDGFDMVVVANDIDLAVRGFSEAVQGSRGVAPR